MTHSIFWWQVCADEYGVYAMARYDEREHAENARASHLRLYGKSSEVVAADDAADALERTGYVEIVGDDERADG